MTKKIEFLSPGNYRPNYSIILSGLNKRVGLSVWREDGRGSKLESGSVFGNGILIEKPSLQYILSNYTHCRNKSCSDSEVVNRNLQSESLALLAYNAQQGMGMLYNCSRLNLKGQPPLSSIENRIG